MLSLSKDAADTVNSISNIVIILAAFITLSASICAFWSQSWQKRHSDVELAGLKAAAAEANAAAIRANADLERERNERLRLEAAVSSRRLAPEARTRIIAAARQFLAGKSIIVELANDQEARLFGHSIAQAFKEGGAIVSIQEPTRFPIPTGLRVNGRAGMTLVNVLKAGNLTFAADAGEGPLRLVVGTKVPSI